MQNFVAELVGTLILVLLGDGVVANVVLNKTKGQNSGWIVITVGWGVAVAMAVYAVGRISGAHLNPAVTIGLAAIGSFPWPDVPACIAAHAILPIVGKGHRIGNTRGFRWSARSSGASSAPGCIF